jgi:hypothetical protein
MKKLYFLIIAFLVVSIPVAFADEDEYEYDDDKFEEREGFGLMEREREREHDDDEDLAIGSDTGNLILYVTLGAIAASIGYTAFKILKTKRPMVSKK